MRDDDRQKNEHAKHITAARRKWNVNDDSEKCSQENDHKKGHIIKYISTIFTDIHLYTSKQIIARSETWSDELFLSALLFGAMKHIYQSWAIYFRV